MRGPKRKDQDDSSQDGRRGSIASRLRHVTTRADERCCGSRLALHRALGPVAAPRPPRAGRAGQLAPARGLRAGRIKFSDIPQISAHADRQRGLSTDTTQSLGSRCVQHGYAHSASRCAISWTTGKDEPMLCARTGHNMQRCIQHETRRAAPLMTKPMSRARARLAESAPP